MSQSKKTPIAAIHQANGLRLRKFNKQLGALAKADSLDPKACRQFIARCGLPPYAGSNGAALQDVSSWMTPDKKTVADELTIDWQGLIDFMNALTPIIAGFMADCPAS